MKPTLQFRLSQHLTLTPQLQQSIRLLQLSTVELNQELEQALADNPLLERDDDPLATAVRLKSDGSISENDAPAPRALRSRFRMSAYAWFTRRRGITSGFRTAVQRFFTLRTKTSGTT